MQTQNIIMPNNNHNKNNIATTTNNNNKNIISLISTSVSIPQPHSHSSTTQACAACKYRRRKCASDCLLAPYFPHDRQQQFLNAHRLFGVSNILKIVRHLTPPEKDLAMCTIIFESNAHAADPVGGCHRIIRDLEQQISLARAELEIVLRHLALCRVAAQQQQVVPPSDAGYFYDEKQRGQYSAEDEVVTVDDVDSWGCVHENVHAHAESTSSSFPHNHDHHHGRRLSMEECTNDMIRPVLDHSAFDDDERGGEFNVDYHANIITSNNGSLSERATFTEDDECFS